jgi:hypothetical protein
VFASTGEAGMWASDDDGGAWRRLSGLTPTRINAVAAEGELVVAGTYDEGAFVSRDGGETWRPSNDGLTERRTRRALIAGARILLGTNAGLFASDDQGTTWKHVAGDTQVKGLAPMGDDLFMADLDGVRRLRDGEKTTVLPDVIVHNLAFGPALFALRYTGGVSRTDDRGATWVDASDGLPPQYTFQLLAIPGGLPAAQWDGVYFSPDSRRPWQPRRTGLPSEASVTDLVRLPGGRILAAAVRRAGRDWPDTAPAQP